MPINTPRIGLFKKDTLTEGTDTFNIKTMMNDNWDKLDKKVALIDPLTGKLLPGQENATEVDLSDLATKRELQTVDQKVTAHMADYVAHPGVATTMNVGNAYAVTLNPAPTEYKNAMGLILTINATSTGASTINVNGKGVIPLKNSNGNPVTNLKKDGVYTVRYSAGTFILQGESEVEIGQQIIKPGTTNKPILKGVHNGLGYVEGSPNLVAANIKKNVNMFGVVGTHSSFSLDSSYGGLKFALYSAYNENLNFLGLPEYNGDIVTGSVASSTFIVKQNGQGVIQFKLTRRVLPESNIYQADATFTVKNLTKNVDLYRSTTTFASGSLTANAQIRMDFYAGDMYEITLGGMNDPEVLFRGMVTGWYIGLTEQVNIFIDPQAIKMT